MLLADGTLKIYALTDVAEKGDMPREELVCRTDTAVFYANRVVGYSRQYAAMGVNQQIDRLVRIWDVPVEIGQYAILDEGDQFRIDNVQYLRDEDGLKVVDLTLRKVEEGFDHDIYTGQAEGSEG